MNMTVYLFDDVGYYQGSKHVNVTSPLPVNSTAVEPELVEGSTPQFLFGEWRNVPTAEIRPLESPSAARPTLIVTQIVSDNANSFIELPNRQATCSEGTTLTATAELRVNDVLVPLNATFRMPIQSKDGRIIVALAEFIDGVANVVVPFRQSGIWEITEETINSGLPAEEQMDFEGLLIFVTIN